MKIPNVPFHRQSKDYTCGPSALRMVFDYWGIKKKEDELARRLNLSAESPKGTLQSKMIEMARAEGLEVKSHSQATLSEISLAIMNGCPVIVDYLEPSNDEYHYAVVVGETASDFILNDPWNGEDFRINKDEFLARWKDGEGSHRWLMICNKIKDI